MDKRIERGLFILLMLTALAVRLVWCNRYFFVDESVTFFDVLNFLRNRTYMPVHFNYPSLFSYMALIPIGITAVVAKLAGITPSFAGVEALYSVHPLWVMMPVRLLSVALGMATLAVVYGAGKRFFSAKTGLFACALLAVSPMHIARSALALPDVTMTFFAALAVHYSLWLTRTESKRHYLLAGLFAGLATSAKYNALFITSAVAAAHGVVLHRHADLFRPLRWITVPLLVAIAGFFAGFVIGTPGWVLDPKPYYDALLFDIDHMAQGHLGAFGVPVLTHAIYLLRTHTVLTIALAAGLILFCVRRKPRDIVLLITFAVSFGYISAMTNKAAHYIIFILPVMVLIAGDAINGVIAFARKPALQICLAIALFAYPVYDVVTSGASLFHTDSRVAGKQWVHENIPAGSVIIGDFIYNIRSYIPQVLSEDTREENLAGDYKDFYSRHYASTPAYKVIPLVYDPHWLQTVDANYLITSDRCFDRFFTTPAPAPDNPLYETHMDMLQTYALLFGEHTDSSWELVKEIDTGNGPRIVIFKKTNMDE